MRSDGTTLYIEGSSPLHSHHPFGKLALVLLTGVMVYCAPGGWIPDAAMLALIIILTAASGIFPAVWKFALRTILPLSLFMLPIHGFLNPDNHTPLLTWQSMTLYREGLLFAGMILLQLTTIITASLIFVFTTHPADLLSALKNTGCPPSLAYLFGSPLLMLPAMRTRINTIQSAQRSRGLDSDGNILKRIRALGPLVAPLVLGAFSEIEQRAIALELRGFRSQCKQTSLREVPDSKTQQILRWLMVLTALLLLLYKVVC